ncbi:ABC transporter permease [uncultured Robinsoniella sp.]|uniref:ABC transporter permease n=1 Tax=uncultured Robinsoniella sp. TaxID=904190 RepID=UPI00374F7E90
MNKIALSLNDTFTMVSRSMKHTTRQVEILIMTAVLPLAQLLMLVFIIGGSMQIGEFTYLDYILPGILLLSIASSASMTAISVKEDMTKGIMDRFRTMDIGKTAVLNGHMAATLLRCAITALIVLSVAVLIGFRAKADFLDYLTIFLIVFLFSLMYTWAAIVWGLFCPSLESVSAFTYIGMLLPYVSSCFVPVENMPAVLRIFAKYQPFTPLADSIRGLFLDIDTGNAAFIAIAWCLGLLVVFYICSLKIYHRRANR